MWLGIIITGFVLFKKYVDVNYLKWLEPVYENPPIVISIFLISEVVFGIIPPEIFMIWALRHGDIAEYEHFIGLFAIISYASGMIGYFFGRYLDTTLFYRYIRRRFLRRSERRLNQYGPYIIIVSALTPLPFSGVSMLIGSVKYPFKNYIFYSLFRFLRFAVYAWIVWKANFL